MEIHTQLRNELSNRESKKAIRNQPSIRATLIISVMNVMGRKQIHASNVYRRIISLQIVRNWTLQIRKFTGTLKILKLVNTDQ